MAILSLLTKEMSALLSYLQSFTQGSNPRLFINDKPLQHTDTRAALSTCIVIVVLHQSLVDAETAYVTVKLNNSDLMLTLASC